MKHFITLAIVAHLGITGVGPVRAQDAGGEMSDVGLETHLSDAGEIEYRLHLPEAGGAPTDLVVVLHGCLQTAADVAVGTGMDAMADEHGFAVLYPQQSPERNPQRCWNWFLTDQQSAEGPEVSMLSELVAEVQSELEIPAARTHLVGISAGGAMAGVLAVARPDLAAGVVSHSGTPWGSASTLAEGVAVMQTGGPERIDLSDPRLERVLAADLPRRVLLIHGADDAVVRPVNSERSAERWARILAARVEGGEPGPPEEFVSTVENRELEIRRWDLSGGARVQLVLVPGLGHAWSGGSGEGSYTDPDAPSASRMVVRFLDLGR